MMREPVKEASYFLNKLFFKYMLGIEHHVFQR